MNGETIVAATRRPRTGQVAVRGAGDGMIGGAILGIVVVAVMLLNSGSGGITFDFVAASVLAVVFGGGIGAMVGATVGAVAGLVLGAVIARLDRQMPGDQAFRRRVVGVVVGATVLCGVMAVIAQGISTGDFLEVVPFVATLTVIAALCAAWRGARCATWYRGERP